MPTELFLLLALMVIIGAWLDAKRQHEHALAAARHVCDSQGVQLLDHTVSLTSLKPRRHDGRLTLERHYTFEVSVNGSDRQQGTLWIRHGQLAGVRASWLKPPDVHSLDARSAVTEMLERISHNRSS